jgi:hypothetical protein
MRHWKGWKNHVMLRHGTGNVTGFVIKVRILDSEQPQRCETHRIHCLAIQ